MLRRLGVPVLLLALAVPLGAAPVAAAPPAADVAQRAAASRCTTASLVDRSAIRTEAGATLGTARMYAARSGDGLDFCVRITPVDRLRSRDTAAFLRWSTVSPDGVESPLVPTIRLSWKSPFVLHGAEPGETMKAVATLRAPDGTKGTARISGTVS